jgi:hypothetical protein
MAFKFITTEQAAKTAPMRSQTTPWKKWALIAGGVLVAWYFFGNLLGLLFSRAHTPRYRPCAARYAEGRRTAYSLFPDEGCSPF